MKNLYSLSACVFFCIQILQASITVNEEEPVQQLLTSYIDLINKLEKKEGFNDILELYSEQYSGNTTYVRLSGGISKKTYDKTDLKKQMEEIIKDEDYKFTVKLNKILYSNQKENAGTISALLDFESHIEDKLAEKGTLLINVVGVNQKGKWKIIQNNMVRVSESKDIGNCVCYIYDKGDTKFVTELYYPAGMSYDHKFDTFQFASNGDSRIVKSSGKNLIWEKGNNKIMNENKEIGIASSPKKVIELLIKKENRESCAQVIFK